MHIPLYKKKMLFINFCCCKVTWGHSVITFALKGGSGDPLKCKRMRTRGEGDQGDQKFASFLIEHVVRKLLTKNDQIFS